MNSATSERHSPADSTHRPLLSVLVVSFNTCELTLKALRTLHENTNHPFELVIVDNASDDGSADAIEREFPNSRLIRNKANLGFAGANNKGANYASGDALLLLNPDTEILPGAIDELMRLREKRPDAGIWGGTTIYGDGSPNLSSCWRRQTIRSLIAQATGLSSLFPDSRALNPERMMQFDETEPTEVDIVSGCMLLIDRDFFQRLGGFSKRFFMYGEDADLCLRAQMQGARPVIAPDATIIHHGGSSERVPAEKLIRLLTAKATLIHVHFPRNQRRLGIFLLAAWPFSRMLAWRLLSMLGSERARERAQTWSMVWQRHREWIAGFRDPEAA